MSRRMSPTFADVRAVGGWRVGLYHDGPYRGMRFACRAGDACLYMGRSFDLERRIQRQRISRDCGYVQLAYGRVRHFGMAARRTLGLQIMRSLMSRSSEPTGAQLADRVADSASQDGEK